MPQNECQQMLKTDFYQSLRNKLSTLYNILSDLQRVSEFLNTMDAATATNMGMDATTTTDVSNLRTAITEMMDFYEGTATPQTRVLKDQVNKLRYL